MSHRKTTKSGNFVSAGAALAITSLAGLASCAAQREHTQPVRWPVATKAPAGASAPMPGAPVRPGLPTDDDYDRTPEHALRAGRSMQSTLALGTGIGQSGQPVFNAPAHARALVEAPSQGPAQTTNVARVSFSDEGADFDPAVSPDGATLVYASTQHRAAADLYVKRVDSRVVTRLTSDPSQDCMPAISPDGTMVAFASDRSGNWDIFVMPISGGKAVQLTSDAEHEIAPSWSPDGGRLVYSRLGSVSQRWEMWVARTDRPDVANFLGAGLFPRFAPQATSDGVDRVLFQVGRERGRRSFAIWTLDLRDTAATNHTQVVASATDALINPAWSPRGQWIVYAQAPAPTPEQGASTQLNRSSLWMVSLMGEGTVRLTAGESLALNPTWASDNRLYFVSDRSGVDNIWSLDMAQPLASAVAVLRTRMNANDALALEGASAPMLATEPADEATPDGVATGEE
jgi:Tol biopolymer transport system component